MYAKTEQILSTIPLSGITGWKPDLIHQTLLQILFKHAIGNYYQHNWRILVKLVVIRELARFQELQFYFQSLAQPRPVINQTCQS